MQDSKFELAKAQRVRIDINSAPELKKKALDQELVQVPRVFINENGEIIKNDSPRKVTKKAL